MGDNPSEAKSEKGVNDTGRGEWWQRGMAYYGRGGGKHTSKELYVTTLTSSTESREMENLEERFEEYKKQCEENRRLLKERFEERKSRETGRIRERYEEKRGQCEENRMRLKERFEERKSRK